jgi:Zn finger protein HypA/HybF involved in hydrogenase expression
VLIAMAALIAWLGSYAVLCAVKPFGPCRRCSGTGEIERFNKTRTCPRCRGANLRLRLGRRAHNAWRRTHQAGSR